MKSKLILFLLFLLLGIAGCNQSAESPTERRIHNLENGLLAEFGDPFWKRMPLAERMAHYNVPGVSIAAINNNQLEWARGYGVMEAGSEEPVTPNTLFQAASISKLLTAVAALGMVDHGALDLDQDVNERLVSWQVPQNEFTEIEPVTLRRLLSHSAGIYERAYDGYVQGQELPTLLDILNGRPPANSPPVDVVAVPGTEHIYANGGYMVVQQLLEDISGQSFDDLLGDTVLEPWGMEASTFEAPLPEQLRQIAAIGHQADGKPIEGGWRTYPERAAASLWTTPKDLAQFAIRLMEIQSGKQDPILSQEMAQEMLTVQMDGRGLGPELQDDGGDRIYFSHPGGNYGYKVFLTAYPRRGQGVVIMTNGENGAALWREILNGFSVEYGLVPNYTVLYVGILIVILLGLFTVALIRRNRARHKS